MAPRRIECFLLEETDVASSALRRYVRDEERQKCAVHPWGYHNAVVALEDVQWTAEERWSGSGETRRRIGGTSCGPLLEQREDPRWPKACACDYEFRDDDVWQHNVHQLYRVPATGQLVDVSDHQTHAARAPAGAMWFAWWYEGIADWCGPDGHALMVMTPGGSWHVDGPANNGPGWDRSGEPPKVTANPSILITGKYHGWLRDGWLEEC